MSEEKLIKGFDIFRGNQHHIEKISEQTSMLDKYSSQKEIGLSLVKKLSWKCPGHVMDMAQCPQIM